MKDSIILDVGLIQGRHNIREVLNKYIFPPDFFSSDISGFQFERMEKQIDLFLSRFIFNELHLYTTGFTPAQDAVINHCLIKKIPLVIYHYDRMTRKYVGQRIHTVIGG